MAQWRIEDFARMELVVVTDGFCLAEIVFGQNGVLRPSATALLSCRKQ
jgi:hypothetical protein